MRGAGGLQPQTQSDGTNKGGGDSRSKRVGGGGGGGRAALQKDQNRSKGDARLWTMEAHFTHAHTHTTVHTGDEDGD